MSITDIVVLLLFVLVVLLGALSYQLLRQNGRVLLRLDALEARAGADPTPRRAEMDSEGLRGNKPLSNSQIMRTGLPPGSRAPDFCLPLVGQGELGLAQYRGKPLLLVFSDPECGPCNRLAPRLEAFHRRHPSLPVVMVSRGAREANEQKATELGLSFPVVLQRQWEVSRLYGMFSTPIAFAIDAQGVIDAAVASGVDAILALAAQVVAQAGEKEVAAPQPG